MTDLPLLWIVAAARVFAAIGVHVLWRATLGAWWWVVAAGLALAMAPTLVGAVPSTLEHGLAVSVVLELVLGAVLGLVASLPGYAVLGAAMASAAVLRTAPRPLLALYACLVLAIAMHLDLHQPVLLALRGSFDLFPAADVDGWATLAMTRGVDVLVRVGHTSLVLALALATPVLLTSVVVDLATGLVAQAPAPIPQLAPVLRAAARGAAALVALGASWAAYAPAWARAFTLAP